jgi:hypothetical protein
MASFLPTSSALLQLAECAGFEPNDPAVQSYFPSLQYLFVSPLSVNFLVLATTTA